MVHVVVVARSHTQIWEWPVIWATAVVVAVEYDVIADGRGVADACAHSDAVSVYQMGRREKACMSATAQCVP